ncbi:uncharacterized protein LOC111338407 [Stylophora pistillata]|uniref:uncharacterized protein LOC111338407 n=1 Tax=Stylophora pistillata TaxID=50429 RepID=UPI000C04A95B|nr:uncharacterized protein LOC111338407 [Stylophora pistillata]
MDEGKAPTRIGILSVVSFMYDCLVLVAFIILPAKSLSKNLCKQEYGWDEEISDADSILWQDASEYGYGAVSYLRIVDDKGVPHCSFVLGKSCVTPLKTVSIPRLDLAAAVVAVNLNCLIRNELEYPIHDTIYWTDSTIVLQYIRNESRRFHTFVANRVAMIHDESTPRQWRHVDTCGNPADIASRGAKGSELHKLERWLNGPKFLWKEEENWPRTTVPVAGIACRRQ